MRRDLKEEEESAQAKAPRRTMTLAPFIIIGTLALAGLGRAASGLQVQEQRLASRQADRQANNSATSLAFGDLVAIGAISLVDSSAAGQTRASGGQPRPLGSPASGRLVDRIASPALDQAEQRQQQRQLAGAPNKLDYIIDFMRQNRLTKFCDLLMSSEPEIKQLVNRLNSLSQFTLFVPTNEALLLMADHSANSLQRQQPTLAELKSQPRELRQFLMAHLSNELIIPKLNLANVKESIIFYHWFDSLNKINQSQQQATASSTNLAYSLANNPLRITTAAYQNQPKPLIRSQNLTSQLLSSEQDNTKSTTKLELIVNGANVLNGHSYALQEPNNTNVTYAIVHLIDRSLYQQIPTMLLINKIRSVAPRMARYIQQLQEPDAIIIDLLESTAKLSTLFLPNDDAFKSVPEKQLDQLQTNQTYLNLFIKNHLVEGLYYSGQLAPSLSSNLNDLNKFIKIRLSSISNIELEFESKMLQSRQLILVNSIPVLESDIMTLNGVIHLISRPIFGDQLEAECNCNQQAVAAPNKLTSEQPSGFLDRLWPPWPQSNRAQQQQSLKPANPVNLNVQPTNELEREESNVKPSLLRSQRSQSNLEVNKNNRNFYRPTIQAASPTAPPAAASGGDLITSTNPRLMAAAEQQANGSGGGGTSLTNGQIFINRNDFNQLLNDQSRRVNNNGTAAASLSFEDENRYKVVLNAAIRQKLREQSGGAKSTATDSLPSSSGLLFSYDRPLTLATGGGNTNASASNNLLETSTMGSANGNKRFYSTISSLATSAPASGSDRLQAAASSSSSNVSSWLHSARHSSPDQLASLATSRQQRLLKFQPEDARDEPLAGQRLAKTAGSGGDQPANQPQLQRFREQTASKTAAPPGFGGCAFYDADCKRLLSKLVRLPPNGNRKSVGTATGHMLASASTPNNQSSLAGFRYQLAGNSDPQHLDSTFGETTENPSQAALRQQQQQQLQNRLTAPKVSPLNQPLPPWSEEDQRFGQLQPSSWAGVGKAQDADISRIVTSSIQKTSPTTVAPTLQYFYNKPTTSTFVRQQPPPTKVPQQQQAQIILMPVKNPQQFLANLSQQIDNNNQNINLNSFASGPSIHLDGLANRTQASSNLKSQQNNVLFNSRQYHTPTPYSVSLVTTHIPSMFNSQHSSLGRLTNFTAIETLPVEESTSAKLLQNQFQRQQQLLSPMVLRKQQQFNLSSGNLNAGSADDIKQARKIIRLQSNLNANQPAGDNYNSDISITSARLTAANHSTNSGLATDQSANVNFIRSVPATLGGEENQTQSQVTDFFQNRTISEIMDDSGLRIDGQHVTFSRLKECLAEADLLSLVTQTGNTITIFMPTDLAFQRLIQQQAALYNQRQSILSDLTLNRNSMRSRLLDPSRRYLLPLVVAKRPSAPLTSSSFSNAPPDRFLSEITSSNSLEPAMESSLNSMANKLTLDCSSSMVKQFLLDHLSAKLMTPKQLLSDMSLGSLSGHQLLLSSVPSKKIVVVDGQPVIAATRAKNGMVYVVNKFLNLTQQVPNVIQLIESQPNLTTFLSYLTFSTLADRLKREPGPLTILAPTNAAFDQLSSSARQLLNSDQAALLDILRNHIVEGAQFGKLISMRNKLNTMNADHSIEAKVIRPNVYLLDNENTSIKLLGTTGNGVVNSIDRLLIPPWLKKSMSSNLPQAQPTDSVNRGNNLFIGELESTSLDSNNNLLLKSGLNNLPSIGNRPIRFNELENPAGDGARLLMSNSNQPVTNSFLLPNNASLSATTDFNAASFGDNNQLFTTPRSPFLKVASNLTGSSLANNIDNLEFNKQSALKTNVTRNMLLIEKLANLMQTNRFVKYLLKSKVSQLLKPDMNYVLLVPTDQAIDKLPRQIIDMLERDEDRLNDLMNYHVLDTTFEYINTIPDGQTLNTLNEKDILFNWHRNNTILTASGAVVMGGIQEDNIALLIVDRVLYPTPGDLLNIVSKSPILSNFTSIIRNAILESQLSLAGPFTLFAPSDFAFNQLAKRDLEFLQRDRETARRFLFRHLSQPAIFTSSIALSNQTAPVTTTGNGAALKQSVPVPTMMINNLLGEDLTLKQKNDYFSVNDVNFSYADVAATNGVVHVIDGLL